ncbi:MAG: hypothetical protein NC401_19415 [Ruminococcus sp.]|nr:hypothetical protein [Ruminococcus sp.]
MSTILIAMNERKYAKSVLSGNVKRLLKNPLSTLRILAKYYFSTGLNKSEIGEKLRGYINEKHLTNSQEQCKSMISAAMKNLGKYPLVEIDEIPVSKSEIDRIMSIRSQRYNAHNAKTLQKLAFSLLCLARYQLMSGRSEPWININVDKLFTIANIDCSSREIQLMHLLDLKNLGLIDVTSSPSDSAFKVLYVQQDQDKPEIVVRDLNECGMVYEQYLGAPYVHCERCGALTPIKSNRTKYCKDCSEQVNREKTMLRMRENRANEKNILSNM